MRALFVAAGAVLALGALSAGCFGCVRGCGQGYSDGERTGVVSKFSNKGLVWKSWEGELNCGGLRTQAGADGKVETVANVWRFHASDAQASEIQDAMRRGAPITVRYSQWFNGPIKQDSDYDVVSVAPVAP